jgi:uncharacterized protein (TIGR02466 family)
MNKIHEIFPIPVYEADLDLDIVEMERLCNEHQGQTDNRKVSNVGGFQSHISLLNNNFKELFAELEKHVQIYSKTFLTEQEQHLDNIWLNVNGYKNSNVAHVHPGCNISGCYYVKVPSESGSITFEHPAIDMLSWYQARQDINTSEFKRYSTLIWDFFPKKNTLYLFPSWLRHSVRANENLTEKRISIAFNFNSGTHSVQENYYVST